MFQVSLSKPLAAAALALALLSGCAATTRDTAPPHTTTVRVSSDYECAPLQDWLVGVIGS